MIFPKPGIAGRGAGLEKRDKRKEKRFNLTENILPHFERQGSSSLAISFKTQWKT
jgi:hypothetical protein